MANGLLAPIEPGQVRVVTLGGGRRVTLAAYMKAVRVAKAHPNHLFPEGFNGWAQTGAEVVATFREGLHDRINQRGAAA